MAEEFLRRRDKAIISELRTDFAHKSLKLEKEINEKNKEILSLKKMIQPALIKEDE